MAVEQCPSVGFQFGDVRSAHVSTGMATRDLIGWPQSTSTQDMIAA
jgi:hypothetical protein